MTDCCNWCQSKECFDLFSQIWILPKASKTNQSALRMPNVKKLLLLRDRESVVYRSRQIVFGHFVPARTQIRLSTRLSIETIANVTRASRDDEMIIIIRMMIMVMMLMMMMMMILMMMMMMLMMMIMMMMAVIIMIVMMNQKINKPERPELRIISGNIHVFVRIRISSAVAKPNVVA